MKKSILVSVITVMIAVLGRAQECTLPANLQNGLVGYWPFNENTFDESANGNNGTNNGVDFGEDRFGNLNSAGVFDGNDYVLVENAIDQINTSSVCGWFNSAAIQGAAFVQFGNDNPNTGCTGMSIGQGAGDFIGDGNNLHAALNCTTGWVTGHFELPPPGTWTHFAMVKAPGRLSLFINGVLVAYRIVGEPTFDLQTIFFGASSASLDYSFQGLLDDIYIYDRNLTEAEVAELYSSNSGLTARIITDGRNTLPVGSPITLTTNEGTYTYQWYLNGNTIDGATQVNYNPITSGSYTVSISNGVCSTTSLPVVITFTVNPIMCELPQSSFSNGVIGFWPFCGTHHDLGPNMQNTKSSGATLTTDRYGTPNAAYHFNGSTDFMIVEDALSNLDTISLVGWYKSDFIQGGAFAYVGVNSPVYGCDGIGIGQGEGDYITDGNNLHTDFGCSGGWLGPGIPLPDPGSWNQFGFSKAGDDYRIYLNGQLIQSYQLNTPSLPTNWIFFGAASPGGDYAFSGSLDDLIVFDRALSANEFVQHFEQNYEPVSCSQLPASIQQGLVGYWPFCGNATDESGNGNNGVVNGATLTEDRFGNPSSAFDFDGVNDYIEIIQNNFTLDTSFSISVWLNKLPNSVNRILSIERAGAPDGYQFRLGMEEGFWVPNDGQLYFHSGISGIGTLPWDNSIGYELTSNNAITNNTWQHAVVVKQGFNFLLYLNGQLQATVNLETNLSFGSNPNSILLGAVFEAFTNTTTANFLGKLDDIGIWNRALTAEEIALLYGNFTPTIPGCTDPLAFNYNSQATVNEGCEYVATIFVYNDLNGNGTHDGNEPGLTNWPVLSNDINSLVWTNNNGNAFLPLETGSYGFTLINTTDNWLSTTPTSVTIDLTGGPAAATFGLQVIPGEAIVAAGPFTGFWDVLQCTEGYESGVYLENIGSQAVSGFMTLTCDPLFTPNADSYFTTPPVEVGPGYALWNVEDFLPGEYELLSFHIDGPGVEYLNQSFTFAFDLTLFDPQGNMIYSDNWSVSPIVACAYDPNDITGFPEGLSAPHEEGYTIEHYILPDNMVEFRVRFQNTGTLPAEDIDIYIPIDPNQWELNTIFPLMRSAEMQVICLHDDGLNLSILEHELPEGVTAQDLLIFSFDDIYLPDSASNPEGSQGYVYFRMQAKHTLNIGDEISAQAFIYFEQNPAVETNETYHVIFDCTSFTPMVGDTELCDGDNLQFSASQPNVDDYSWNISSLEGSGNIFIFEGIDAGEYTLELNTSNMLCPQGEDHQVNVIVHDIPQLDVPLDETVCEGEELTFEAESDGAITWSNGASTGDIIIAEEDFTVTATAVGAGGCSISADWTVTVNPLPSAEVDSANFVLTAADGVAWQWSVNGVLDATTQSINATENGNYQVEITSEFGCVAMSDVVAVELPIPDNVFVHSWSTLALFPNPMTASARLELPQGAFDIALYDLTGACVRTMSKQQGTVLIDRESLARGVYQVRISSGNDNRSIRLVIE